MEYFKTNSEQQKTHKYYGVTSSYKLELGEIFSDVCQKFVDSIPRRLRSVVQAKGADTKYGFCLSITFYFVDVVHLSLL